MKRFKQILLLVVLSHATIFFIFMIRPSHGNKIIVAQDGSGQFKTIQEAINSLPADNSTQQTIFIKKGVYHEKLLIEKPNILLEGESADQTVISFNIARDEWRCEHADDWGVATVNVRANDITLKDLSVINDYATTFKDHTIECPTDSVNHFKQIRRDGHQMALRVMNATRLRAFNCHFTAFGGDTVSPWDVENGQWYFKGCTMEGGVDFYCPRGWAWAENCIFICTGGPAAIWHDGSANADSKSVLVNCSFSTNVDSFYLGRYHRDAQFFLLGCKFPRTLKDTPIYLVPTKNTIRWGQRTYYYNCQRDGGNYNWFANNLPAGLKPSDITVDWLFKGSWHPERDN